LKAKRNIEKLRNSPKDDSVWHLAFPSGLQCDTAKERKAHGHERRSEKGGDRFLSFFPQLSETRLIPHFILGNFVQPGLREKLGSFYF
jgi:hypothetical protein